MTVYLLDNTKNKLFLAAEFLSFLNNRPEKVKLLLSKDSYSAYGAYFQLFGNIQIKQPNAQDVLEDNNLKLSFIDNYKNVQRTNLYFPILRKEQMAAYNKRRKKRPYQFIPLDNEEKAGGYYTAETVSACDLFMRKILINDLKGIRILISAGPTAEDLDPVRYLTNRSTGKMGIALARAAFTRGAQVHLVLGPTSLRAPAYLSVIKVRSAKEMSAAVLRIFPEVNAYIGAAAVADFRPQVKAQNKIKKGNSALTLTLERTTDILRSLHKLRREQLLIGFSVETNNELKNSRQKMNSKHLDLMVVNNPKNKGAAFAADTNLVTIISRQGTSQSFPLLSKLKVSHIILDRIRELLR